MGRAAGPAVAWRMLSLGLALCSAGGIAAQTQPAPAVEEDPFADGGALEGADADEGAAGRALEEAMLMVGIILIGVLWLLCSGKDEATSWTDHLFGAMDTTSSSELALRPLEEEEDDDDDEEAAED